MKLYEYNVADAEGNRYSKAMQKIEEVVYFMLRIRENI